MPLTREAGAPTDRIFDPERPFLAYPLAVDFANSIGLDHRPLGPADLLAERPGLDRWLALERHALGDLGAPAPSAVNLAALRDLRQHVATVLRAAAEGRPLPATDVRAINAASAAAPVHLELEATGRVTATRSDAPSWQADLEGRVARSAIELVAGHEASRLSVCAAPSCGMLFVASRAGQRWCSGSCGNRARVARHYSRRRQSESSAEASSA